MHAAPSPEGHALNAILILESARISRSLWRAATAADDPIKCLHHFLLGWSGVWGRRLILMNGQFRLMWFAGISAGELLGFSQRMLLLRLFGELPWQGISSLLHVRGFVLLRRGTVPILEYLFDPSDLLLKHRIFLFQQVNLSLPLFQFGFERPFPFTLPPFLFLFCLLLERSEGVEQLLVTLTKRPPQCIVFIHQSPHLRLQHTFFVAAACWQCLLLFVCKCELATVFFSELLLINNCLQMLHLFLQFSNPLPFTTSLCTFPPFGSDMLLHDLAHLRDLRVHGHHLPLVPMPLVGLQILQVSHPLSQKPLVYSHLFQFTLKLFMGRVQGGCRVHVVQGFRRLQRGGRPLVLVWLELIIICCQDQLSGEGFEKGFVRVRMVIVVVVRELWCKAALPEFQRLHRIIPGELFLWYPKGLWHIVRCLMIVENR